MIASSLRHSIRTLRRRTSSSVSLAINGLFLLLAWTFLPLENAQWHAVMSRRAVLYPQIDFKRLKPLDGLRMFVQSVYLLFFYITDEPLVSSRLDQDHAAHDSLLRRAGVALRNAGLSLRGLSLQKAKRSQRPLPHALHSGTRPEPRRLRTNLFEGNGSPQPFLP